MRNRGADRAVGLGWLMGRPPCTRGRVRAPQSGTTAPRFRVQVRKFSRGWGGMTYLVVGAEVALRLGEEVRRFP